MWMVHAAQYAIIEVGASESLRVTGDQPGDQPGRDTNEGAGAGHAVLRVLAVLGPAVATPQLEAVAESVGEIAAGAGWVVLTGGGPGVMAAACRGAAARGGLTVGILPVARPGHGYPNPWVRLPIFTGSGSARNAFNVLSAELCLALGGGAGTLSELALAMKAGRELWSHRSWGLEPPPGVVASPPRRLDDPSELLVALRIRLAAPRSGPAT
jgi:uncharacterized protein (TIGR00725 family)